MLEFQFQSEVIHWRGPAPFFFGTVPPDTAAAIAAAARQVSYGWGMIPVDVTISDLTFYTALFPKDGGYILPLKNAVRRQTGLTAGDRAKVKVVLRARC